MVMQSSSGQNLESTIRRFNGSGHTHLKASRPEAGIRHFGALCSFLPQTVLVSLFLLEQIQSRVSKHHTIPKRLFKRTLCYIFKFSRFDYIMA
jgi:hypothetical protein